MAAPTIIRWKDLEPSWHLPNQEPGIMRWMISWVAGPEGYYNSNPGVAVLSHDVSVGLMHIPSNNRQKALHYHGVAEIYVLLRGEVLGWDGRGEEHRAGPLDCVYIPAGVPHVVRTYGDEPVDLIWVHDAIEKKGTSVYWSEGMPNPQDESKQEIKVVPYKGLEPRWEAAQEQGPGHLHSSINWVGGVKGCTNLNPERAVLNEKVALGLTVIHQGHKETVTGSPNAELCVLVRGKAIVNIENGNGNEELAKMDAVYVPAGCSRTFRNHGDEPAYLLWVREKPSGDPVKTARENDTVAARS